MRINAYILIADPAWIEASVLSYYGLVDKIIVSYDQDSKGWTGEPIEVEPCLRRLNAIDKDNKFVYSPGHYSRLNHKPMENDTYQRQCAIDEAGKGADWILQLDTDEVISSASVFKSCLMEANEKSFDTMNFPSRWLYRHVKGQYYLERCGRRWQVMASYPGPVASRPGATLQLARQCPGRNFNVDLKATSTDPWRSSDTVVHRVIKLDDAIFHFSWVRPESHLRAKSRSSSHAHDFDWNGAISNWLWRGQHPILTTLLAPLRRREDRFRLSHIPLNHKDGAHAR